MRLGAFYGLTVPMFVLGRRLLSDVEYAKLLSVLESETNATLLTDYRKEMSYLLQYLKSFPCEYQSDVQELNELGDFVLEPGENSETKFYDACDKLLTVIGIKLISDIHKGKFYDRSCLNQERMVSVVKSFLQENGFDSSKPKSACVKILRDFKVVAGASALTIEDIPEIEEVFHLVNKPATTLRLNGKLISLSNVAAAFMQFLVNNMQLLENHLSGATIQTCEELSLLGIPVQTYMNGKPTRLYHLLRERFEYVNGTNVEYMELAISSSMNDLQMLEDIIKNQCTTSAVLDDAFTEESFEEFVKEQSVDFQSFLRELVTTGVLNVKCLSPDDVWPLQCAFKLIQALDKDFIASAIGVDSQEVKLGELADELCTVGVYGVNDFGVEPLVDFCRVAGLMMNDKYVRSDAELEELNEVLGKARLLMDSMLKIGDDL